MNDGEVHIYVRIVSKYASANFNTGKNKTVMVVEVQRFFVAMLVLDWRGRLQKIPEDQQKLNYKYKKLVKKASQNNLD